MSDPDPRLLPPAERPFYELSAGLDAAAFWEENQRCDRWTTAKPRCSAGLALDDHWLIEFMGVQDTVRYYQDKTFRDDLHRQVNDLIWPFLHLKPFAEDSWQHQPRRIENLFGCWFAYHQGGTPWLVPATADAGEFERIVDEAAETDLCDWALPPEFRQEWETRRRRGETMPLLGGGSRGPATVITSILDPTVAFEWMEERPALMQRFRDVLADSMLRLNQVLRDFSGNTQTGWFILDDNCALFSPRLYEEFCYPVLQQVMDVLAPAPAMRYQHSDSAMAHLMGLQRRLGIKRVNYGPTVPVTRIRAEMPEAMIDGQLPPFLLRNGTAQDIRDHIKADFEAVGRDGGLHVTTAGSIAGGTGLGRLRWFLWCVQQDCRLGEG